MSPDEPNDPGAAKRAEEQRRAERQRVTAVLIVDENPYCDREGAKLLIDFALPEIRALSGRRTLGQVKETLLWCCLRCTRVVATGAARRGYLPVGVRLG
jgi:hypothetical protein